jgi:hypothetical protein
MTQLPVTFPELIEIIRACGPISKTDCIPKRLRQMMVAQLSTSESRLAARVRQFDTDQMEAVCAYIMQGLNLVAIPAS